jgi:hypothetical protein
MLILTEFSVNPLVAALPLVPALVNAELLTVTRFTANCDDLVRDELSLAHADANKIITANTAKGLTLFTVFIVFFLVKQLNTFHEFIISSGSENYLALYI